MNVADIKGDQSVLAEDIERIVATTPVDDIHTHLYDPAFGNLLLWGLDELLIYHYLISESFRVHPLTYDAFWRLSKTEKANLVWDSLFVQNSPLSEACRGILTTLHRLGLDVKRRDLPSLRKWFAQWKPGDYVSHCLSTANVRTVCMTNSPFDPEERAVWEKGFNRDPRFVAGLRVDPLLVGWPDLIPVLWADGYQVEPSLNEKTVAELRRFLNHWSRKMDPKFVMVSLPPDFKFPSDSVQSKMIEEVLLPHGSENNLPFALMLGVKRAVNPRLQLAGDGVGRSDLSSLENLCAEYPDNKFMATVLSRENQHELCVLARKFRNLHIFGCWWFMNIPSLVEEMTRMRMEMLGTSFTPQHSDARILDQLVYKWGHTREILAKVLVDKYNGLTEVGWLPNRQEVERDVQLLFGGSFEKFLKS